MARITKVELEKQLRQTLRETGKFRAQSKRDELKFSSLNSKYLDLRSYTLKIEKLRRQRMSDEALNGHDVELLHATIAGLRKEIVQLRAQTNTVINENTLIQSALSNLMLENANLMRDNRVLSEVNRCYKPG